MAVFIKFYKHENLMKIMVHMQNFPLAFLNFTQILTNTLFFLNAAISSIFIAQLFAKVWTIENCPGNGLIMNLHSEKITKLSQR